jgi:uridine kinase
VVLALRLDAASPELRALLGAQQPVVETPLERAVNASVKQEQFDTQERRLAIIDGILATPPRSAERTKADDLTALRSGLAAPTLAQMGWAVRG